MFLQFDAQYTAFVPFLAMPKNMVFILYTSIKTHKNYRQ